MGSAAKKRATQRMEPRWFKTSLEPIEIDTIFEQVARSSAPKRGILSKGDQPFFYRAGGVCTVRYGRPRLHETYKSVNVWSPYWVLALLHEPGRFATVIVEAKTINDELLGYTEFTPFHRRFIEAVQSRDSACVELTTTP